MVVIFLVNWGEKILVIVVGYRDRLEENLYYGWFFFVYSLGYFDKFGVIFFLDNFLRWQLDSDEVGCENFEFQFVNGCCYVFVFFVSIVIVDNGELIVLIDR